MLRSLQVSFYALNDTQKTKKSPLFAIICFYIQIQPSVFNSSWFLFLALHFKKVLWRFTPSSHHSPSSQCTSFNIYRPLWTNEWKTITSQSDTKVGPESISFCCLPAKHIESPVAFKKFTACKKITAVNFASAHKSWYHSWHEAESSSDGGEPEVMWHWGVLLQFPSLTKGFGVADELQEKELRLSFEKEKEKNGGRQPCHLLLLIIH